MSGVKIDADPLLVLHHEKASDRKLMLFTAAATRLMLSDWKKKIEAEETVSLLEQKADGVIKQYPDGLRERHYVMVNESPRSAALLVSTELRDWLPLWSSPLVCEKFRVLFSPVT